MLDPSDPRHIRAMAQLLSARLVHGKDSEEYRKQLAGFEEYRRVLQGTTIAAAPEAAGSQPSAAPSQPAARCAPGSATRAEADRLWAEAARLGKSSDHVVLKKGLAALQRSIALCPDPARARTKKALGEKWAGALVHHIANRMTVPKINTDNIQRVR